MEYDNIDRINDKLRRAPNYSDKLGKDFWFDWDSQRRYKLHIATELYLNNDGEDAELAISKASSFINTFYDKIIKKK